MFIDDGRWDGEELDRVRAENVSLKAELKAINAAIDDPAVDLTHTAVECIQSLRQQLEAAKLDAERYRWLRENSCCLILEDVMGQEAQRNPQAELNRAIDQAMKEQQC